MSSVADPNETVSDSGTDTIQTNPKPKRKCTPAQLEVLKRNREKALTVIKAKGERTRLQQELKEQYKRHVDTERDAEIERLKAALAQTEAAPQKKAKAPQPVCASRPTPALPALAKKRKRAPSPSESESDESPSPLPKRKAKKRNYPTPSESSSSESDTEDPSEARLQALHRVMFPFG